MGLLSGHLLACEGDVGSLWDHLGGFGFTLESFWNDFRHMRLTLSNFGVTSASL